MKRRSKLMAWIVTLFWLLSLFTVGCAQKAAVKEKPAGGEAVAQKESAAGAASEKGTTAEGKKVAADKSKRKKGKVESYVVKKGDCLWRIAKMKGIYNDPFLWPVIYEANKDKIKNPNRIYPGQKLVIPRSGMTMDDIKDVRKKAGARKPYTPPSGACAPMS
ncbi:MAG TPA: LysM peptidoglycan-binding domain-containing protein [Syntrophales bacterium]|nr:LysM peptidoglycan-binding domain-containing protein [Syntrophales bacterium]